MHRRHCYDEAEQIVDDCVKEFVEEGVLRHVFHRLESVVYVKLRCHLNEAE